MTARKTFYSPLLHFIVDFARGIIDLPKFNCEDLKEITGGQGSFWVCRYMHTHCAYATAFIVYSIQVFSLYDDKVWNNERKRKRGGRYKTAAITFEFFAFNKSLCKNI